MEVLALERFDIALLDIHMPEMGGIEAAAAIRALEREGVMAHIFIAAITPDNARSDRERYLAADMDGCIAKTVHPGELFNVVENLSIIQLRGEGDEGRLAGVCPAGTVPVYRAFDNRADANHRYTTDRTVRDHMAAIGWTIEGDGPDFVVMCATTMPAPTASSAEDAMSGMPMMPPGYGGPLTP